MALETNTVAGRIVQTSFYMIRGYSSGSFVIGVTPTGGTDVDGVIQSIAVPSDASPGTLNFTVNDPDTTSSISPITYVPCLGEEVLVKSTSVTDKATGWDDEDMEIMFKGIITSRTRQRGANGIVYSIEAQDMKKRLQDEVIKKSYNEVIDNINRPNFDSQGELLILERMTVGEILRDIIYTASDQLFSFPTYDPLIYWTWDNYTEFNLLGDDFFDFSQVGDLANYIPDSLDFDNETLLEAIYRTVSAAGTYRMIYDPVTDHLVFTKISVHAEEAGPERHLFYATADKTLPNDDYTYDDVSSSSYRNSTTGKVNVISDNSAVSNSEMATVFRPYGGEIDWYSGHYHIDPSGREFAMVPNDDSVYNLNHYNWDGYKYNFPFNSLKHIHPSGQYVIVGMPLYPQWNPLKGYSAARIILDDVYELWDDTFTGAINGSIEAARSSYFAGEEEVHGFTVNDALFSESSTLFKLQDGEFYNSPHGLVYEAWFPWSGECAYCDGYGAVDSVAPWGTNIETYFGDSRDSAGVANRPALVTFDYAFVVDGDDVVPTIHPSPHKNICPACKGVGREPRFKVTNINSGLVDISPSEAKVEDSIVGDGAPVTWEDMVKEFSYSYGPQIQIEKTFIHTSAGPTKMPQAELPEHPLAGLMSESHISATEEELTIFAADKQIKTLYPTQISIGDQPTQIDHVRGNVIFDSRYAIQCEKDIKMIQRKGLDALLPKKLIDHGYATAYQDPKELSSLPGSELSYWRPARAWITCTFKRGSYTNDFPEQVASDFDSNTRVGRNPDVIDKDSAIYPSGVYTSGLEYKTKSSIFDNRPFYEIYNEDVLGGTCTVRPIVRGQTIDEYGWTIFPDDEMNLPVPSGVNYSWLAANSVLQEFKDREYFFPTGAIHVMETLKNQEITDDFALEDVGNTAFPKKIEWVLRDDRPLLIKHAIRELEKQNDITISGNVVVRGANYDLAQGMGFVEFTDGARANIVKMTHNFTGTAYNTTLELKTEEFRIGEKTEEEKDTIHKLKTQTISYITKEQREKGRLAQSAKAAKARLIARDSPNSIGGALTINRKSAK
jgi:hypothetical protein